MKIIYKVSALLVGLGVSGITLAEVNTFTTNSTVQTTAAGATQAAGQCALLREITIVGVSANVTGAWECDETENVIKVAACHSGGSRATGVDCTADADGSSANGWTAPNAGCTTNSGTSTIPSFKAFASSSNGGAMSEQSMLDRCNATNIKAITMFTGN